jgi:hypothetical protein
VRAVGGFCFTASALRASSASAPPDLNLPPGANLNLTIAGPLRLLPRRVRSGTIRL